MSALVSSARRTERQEARGTFLRARMGSLLAVAPLGVWTVLHLWNNLSAYKSAAAWQADVTEYKHPIAFFVALVVALVPLALHTVWGVVRLLTSRPNNSRYRHFANAKYLLQRVSALGVALFLGAHVTLALVQPRVTTGRAETFADLAHQMHNHAPTLAVYALGTLGVAYHLANGLHTFTMGWGLVSSRRALRRLDLAAVAAFVVLLAMSWGAIYALWQAGS